MNYVPYDSPDGIPRGRPDKPVSQKCKECFHTITDEICPYCGTENELTYEPDYGPDPEEIE